MVSHVVSEHTNLLYGRHLDQVILCALYGVCKVNQLKQITFKDIITHYKKQAQAKNSIFRTVSIQLNPDLQVPRCSHARFRAPLRASSLLLCMPLRGFAFHVPLRRAHLMSEQHDV